MLPIGVCFALYLLLVFKNEMLSTWFSVAAIVILVGCPLEFQELGMLCK